MRGLLCGLMALSLAMPTILVTTAAAQSLGNGGYTHVDKPRDRPQRYVCVVPPRQSDDRTRPYVCRADAGRVGGTCRCDNVIGSGRLDLDD